MPFLMLNATSYGMKTSCCVSLCVVSGVDIIRRRESLCTCSTRSGMFFAIQASYSL